MQPSRRDLTITRLSSRTMITVDTRERKICSNIHENTMTFLLNVERSLNNLKFFRNAWKKKNRSSRL